MSLYVHHSNSGLDFIVTTEDEDEPESDSYHKRESGHETVETKDSIESSVSFEENIFDIPTFNDKPELPTNEEEMDLFSNDSNKETPLETGNTLSFDKQPSNPKKKETMIKKKKEDPQECTICAKTFTTLRSLQRHTKSIHELQTVDCNECGKTFGGKDNLRTHFKAVHQKIRYPCPTCGVKKCSPKILRDHIKREHPLPSCLFHNLSFQSNEELQEHIQVEHLDKM